MVRNAVPTSRADGGVVGPIGRGVTLSAFEEGVSRVVIVLVPSGAGETFSEGGMVVSIVQVV